MTPGQQDWGASVKKVPFSPLAGPSEWSLHTSRRPCLAKHPWGHSYWNPQKWWCPWQHHRWAPLCCHGSWVSCQEWQRKDSLQIQSLEAPPLESQKSMPAAGTLCCIVSACIVIAELNQLDQTDSCNSLCIGKRPAPTQQYRAMVNETNFSVPKETHGSSHFEAC